MPGDYQTFAQRRSLPHSQASDEPEEFRKSPLATPAVPELDTPFGRTPAAAAAAACEEEDEGKGTRARLRRKARTCGLILRRHMNFLGPGLVAAVAYIDPGNWSTDLQAGANYGYSHLFIILMSGLFAICLQTLATRLGVVSGLDLPQHCRRALHSRPNHTMWWRWGVLYPLYALCEAGIILTDLSELLGSAIAINLLVPAIPLYAGVLLTSLDVLIILALFANYPSANASKSMRIFEFSIGALVAVVLGCFIVLLVKVQPSWSGVFRNYLPNSGFVRPGGLYIAIGIIGATVMPHALLLGSRIATVERYSEEEHTEIANGKESKPDKTQASYSLQMPQPRRVSAVRDGDDALPKPARPEPTVSFISAHVKHAGVDIAMSLMSFALVINSAILIVSAAAFHENPDPDLDTGDLFDAHELIKRRLGPAFAILFALALLLSGQLASITATLAGQVVSEGFLNWTIAPWKRRIITRLISMVPSIAVAVSSGRSGIDTLLVASQVGLSVILPFVIAPLMIFTSTTSIMSIRDYRIPTTAPPAEVAEEPELTRNQKIRAALQCINPLHKRRHPSNEYATFVNQPSVVIIGSTIFTLVVAANVHAFVSLGQGN